MKMMPKKGLKDFVLGMKLKFWKKYTEWKDNIKFQVRYVSYKIYFQNVYIYIYIYIYVCVYIDYIHTLQCTLHITLIKSLFLITLVKT